MSVARRLVTVVDVGFDLDPGEVDVERDTYSSYDALHLAELDDGRRLVLLDDRGWNSNGPPGVWRLDAPSIGLQAKTVVGPDEPPPGRTADEEEALHVAHLARVLAGHGVETTGAELRALPHDVELTDRLRKVLRRR